MSVAKGSLRWLALCFGSSRGDEEYPGAVVVGAKKKKILFGVWHTCLIDS